MFRLEGKEFTPDPRMKKVYHIYATLVFVPLLAVESLVIWVVYLHASNYVWVPVCALLLPTFFVLGFILLWVPRYFPSGTSSPTKRLGSGEVCGGR